VTCGGWDSLLLSPPSFLFAVSVRSGRDSGLCWRAAVVPLAAACRVPTGVRSHPPVRCVCGCRRTWDACWRKALLALMGHVPRQHCSACCCSLPSSKTASVPAAATCRGRTTSSALQAVCSPWWTNIFPCPLRQFERVLVGFVVCKRSATLFATGTCFHGRCAPGISFRCLFSVSIIMFLSIYRALVAV